MGRAGGRNELSFLAFLRTRIKYELEPRQFKNNLAMLGSKLTIGIFQETNCFAI